MRSSSPIRALRMSSLRMVCACALPSSPYACTAHACALSSSPIRALRMSSPPPSLMRALRMHPPFPYACAPWFAPPSTSPSTPSAPPSTPPSTPSAPSAPPSTSPSTPSAYNRSPFIFFFRSLLFPGHNVLPVATISISFFIVEQLLLRSCSFFIIMGLELSFPIIGRFL